MPDDLTPDDRPAAPEDAAEAPPQKGGHAGGFTLDLSSGPSSGQPEAWRRKRKQASPILTKIVDLTAPKPAPALPEPQEKTAKARTKPPGHAAKAPREKRPKDARDRKPGGATLADLLDEETLARLRAEGER
jgi:hypothetical protein